MPNTPVNAKITAIAIDKSEGLRIDKEILEKTYLEMVGEHLHRMVAIKPAFISLRTLHDLIVHIEVPTTANNSFRETFTKHAIQCLGNEEATRLVNKIVWKQ